MNLLSIVLIGWAVYNIFGIGEIVTKEAKATKVN